MAVLVLDLFQDGVQGLSDDGDHFHQQSSGVDAVLAGDVALHSKAAGAFAADDGTGLVHLGGDPLEAYGNLVAGLAEGGGKAVEQVGGGDVADTVALPAFVLHQVVVEQHQNVVGMDESTVGVDEADAVSVAVGRKASAEEGVVAVVDDVHVAAAGEEDGLKGGLGHAKHGV